MATSLLEALAWESEVAARYEEENPPMQPVPAMVSVVTLPEQNLPGWVREGWLSELQAQGWQTVAT